MRPVPTNLGHPENVFTPDALLGEPVPLAHFRHPTIPSLVKVVTRWSPTDMERKRVADGEDVFVVFTCNGSVPLHSVCVGAETVRKVPPMHGPPVVEVELPELPL